MNEDMEYTYEFLRKCHGLRFKAVRNGNDIEGIIKVEKDGIALCYGEETLDNFDYFHRERGVRLVSATGFDWRGITDFEIVPRDPDTYKDWQVGDVFMCDDKKYIILFRCGEVVTYKERGSIYCSALYTCDELFNSDCRLVLTDIEKQILEERKKEEWKPQDGDICYAQTKKTPQRFIFIEGHRQYMLVDLTNSGYGLDTDRDWEYSDIRLATDEEKRKLFDALAKAGKRWNKDEKRFEDIPAPHELKEGDLVLARIDRGGEWKLRVFKGRVDGSERQFKASVDGFLYIYQYGIPYNEETKHLLGTTEDYKEGE